MSRRVRHGVGRGRNVPLDRENVKKEHETMKTKLMTRLALAAAVVALGLCAQAEALYWQASGIKSSSANSLTGTGQYLAYIFADTDSSPSTAQMFQNKNNKSSLVSRDTIKAMLANNQDITQYAFKNGTVNSAVRGNATPLLAA